MEIFYKLLAIGMLVISFLCVMHDQWIQAVFFLVYANMMKDNARDY